jgi:hypothetical protein
MEFVFFKVSHIDYVCFCINLAQYCVWFVHCMWILSFYLQKKMICLRMTERNNTESHKTGKRLMNSYKFSTPFYLMLWGSSFVLITVELVCLSLHCIVCPSSIYGFTLWCLQTFLSNFWQIYTHNVHKGA